MYEIEFSKKAAKFYQKADTVTVQGSYRLRVGNIRIIYSVDDAIKIVYIEVIGFRGDVYKG